MYFRNTQVLGGCTAKDTWSIRRWAERVDHFPEQPFRPVNMGNCVGCVTSEKWEVISDESPGTTSVILRLQKESWGRRLADMTMNGKWRKPSWDLQSYRLPLGVLSSKLDVTFVKESPHSHGACAECLRLKIEERQIGLRTLLWGKGCPHHTPFFAASCGEFCAWAPILWHHFQHKLGSHVISSAEHSRIPLTSYGFYQFWRPRQGGKEREEPDGTARHPTLAGDLPLGSLRCYHFRGILEYHTGTMMSVLGSGGDFVA